MTRVVDWNGRDLPDELRSLPPGKYVVQQVEDAPALTPEEEEGLRAAMAALDAGEARGIQQVRDAVRAPRKP
jgi:hypothetical protein